MNIPHYSVSSPVSRGRAQLSAWILSHTLTTSGQSVRASTSDEAAFRSSWSRDVMLLGTNSIPEDVICIPSFSSEARTLLSSVVSQMNWRESKSNCESNCGRTQLQSVKCKKQQKTLKSSRSTFRTMTWSLSGALWILTGTYIHWKFQFNIHSCCYLYLCAL